MSGFRSLPGAPRASAMAIIEAGGPVPIEGARRFRLDVPEWARLVERLDAEPLEAVSLWSDGEAVHALFLRGEDDAAIASVAVEAGRYLGLSAARPMLSPHERMIRDLWGFEAMAARDLRPLLDHGDWPCSIPLAARPGPAAYPPEPPEFPLSAAEVACGAMQVGSGPVGAPSAGPAHLRLVLEGDRILRVDPLFGFAHRGVVRAMRGLAAGDAVALASRIDASVSVACQCAVAGAVERVARLGLPPRARVLRELMAGLEAALRGAGSIARLARAVERVEIAAAIETARSTLMGAVGDCFGHRLMFDTVVPGGVGRLPGENRLDALSSPVEAAAAAVQVRRPWLLSACERGAGGNGDAVRALAAARFDATSRAFCSVRDRLRAASTTGALATTDGTAAEWSGEGVGAARAIRGVVRCWLRLEGGIVTAFHLHDPGVGRLSGLWEDAGGMSPERFEVFCAAADVVVPGIDQ